MERIEHSGWQIVARGEQRGPVKAREVGLLGTEWEGVCPLGLNVSSSCSIDPQVPVQIHLGGIPV